MTNFDPFAADATSSGGTDAEQIKALLESYGFHDLLGGKWMDDRGQVVTTSAALNDIYTRNYVLAQPPTGATGSTAVPRTPASTSGGAFTQGGVRYIPDGQGGFVPALGAGAPSGGGTGATSTPVDPYTAQLRQQQLALQNAGMQQDMALAQQNQQFLREKFAFEQSEGLKADALKTQQQLFTQGYQIANMQSNIDQFNSQQNVQVQQANFNNGETRASRLQNLATQIGTLAQDAGDRGKYASTVLANSGWGADNSQTDYRTPESLMPLQQLLAIRANSMGGPAPITAQPVSMPGQTPVPGAGLDLSAAMPAPMAPTLPQQAPLPQAAPPSTAGMITAGGVPGVPQPNPYNTPDWQAQQVSPTGVQTAGGFTWDPNGTGGIKAAAQGGIEDGAFISGEKGPELNIPLGNGKVAVLNQQQMDAMGINLKSVMKMAGGGIFDAMAGAGDTSLATDFLAQASQQQRVNTPWAGGGALPSPVYGSSPGFDPIVLDLMASMNALERGYPAAAYKRQAALLQPAGVSEHVVRRSA